MMVGAGDIITFWFSNESRARWFDSTDSFDATIRDRFEPMALELARDRFPHTWEETSEGSLALILALDQFPRNMYRGTPAAFAWDPISLSVAKRTVDRGQDLRTAQERRKFIYMPFMHSERLADQERCVSLCDSRLDDDTLKHAIVHRDIIARFGRFPHRNETLGRESTPAEIEYLKEGGFNPT